VARTLLCAGDPLAKGGTSVVPILLWLLGVPIGLIIVLLLLGVIHF
jgi:hypothetical protein